MKKENRVRETKTNVESCAIGARVTREKNVTTSRVGRCVGERWGCKNPRLSQCPGSRSRNFFSPPRGLYSSAERACLRFEILIVRTLVTVRLRQSQFRVKPFSCARPKSVLALQSKLLLTGRRLTSQSNRRHCAPRWLMYLYSESGAKWNAAARDPCRSFEARHFFWTSERIINVVRPAPLSPAWYREQPWCRRYPCPASEMRHNFFSESNKKNYNMQEARRSWRWNIREPRELFSDSRYKYNENCMKKMKIMNIIFILFS